MDALSCKYPAGCIRVCHHDTSALCVVAGACSRATASAAFRDHPYTWTYYAPERLARLCCQDQHNTGAAVQSQFGLAPLRYEQCTFNIEPCKAMALSETCDATNGDGCVVGAPLDTERFERRPKQGLKVQRVIRALSARHAFTASKRKPRNGVKRSCSEHRAACTEPGAGTVMIVDYCNHPTDSTLVPSARGIYRTQTVPDELIQTHVWLTEINRTEKRAGACLCTSPVTIAKETHSLCCGRQERSHPGILHVPTQQFR